MLLAPANHALTAALRALGLGGDPGFSHYSPKSDGVMLRSLTPEQRKVYFAAQKEHVQLARRLRQAAARMGEQEAANAS